VVYLLLGLVQGLAMGISSDYSLSSVHAHILLLGWLTLATIGLVYLALPRCAQSRLATLHFWGHNLGLPVMMVSLALEAYGQKNAEAAIAAGSVLVLLSLLFFAVNLFLNGRPDRP
jgi:cbb3-type cytochrome oxidase subunit 1